MNGIQHHLTRSAALDTIGRRWRFLARASATPVRTTTCIAAGVKGCVR